MTPTQQKAKELVRYNGLEKALKIASRSAAACHLDVWNHLPKGKVFCEGGKRAEGTLSFKEFNTTRNFWIEVSGLLKKIK